MNETVKTLLGEELASQVEAALKGKGKDGKDVELVVGNDGSYVPADKYDALKGQSGSAERALKAAAEALKAIGGSGDPAKIADDVKTAQSTLDTLEANHAAELQRIQKRTALKLALAGKAHDPEDIIGMLQLDDIETDEQGGLKTDIEALVQPIKDSKPYLFKPDPAEAPEIKGAKPAEPGVASKELTPADVEKMSMSDYRAYREQQGGFPKN